MVSGGVVQVWPCDHFEAVWTILYDGSTTKYNKYTATPLVPMVTETHSRESIFCTQDPRAVRLLKLLEPDQKEPIDLCKASPLLMHNE